MRTGILFLTAFSVVIATSVGSADEPPQGPGLAARYPGDAGIEKDPAVLFADRFDAGTIAEISRRWDSATDADDGVLSLSDDVPFPDLKGHSLKVTATPDKNTGGHLYTRLPRGVDRAFARFYVKFPEQANYIHHFPQFGGYNPATAWPQGGAGSRPKGDDRITVGIEPAGSNGRVKPPGHWNFYAYWHEMKVSAGGRYWGNGMAPAEPLPVPAGKWQCVEVMIQLNTPGKPDGELALWLDGELKMHIKKGTPRGPWTGMGFEVLEKGGEPFEGFDFRTDDDLKVNFFWLLHYVTRENNRRNRAEDRENPVWFDHIVVATEYIGPVHSPQR